jgi:hypothetical protein
MQIVQSLSGAVFALDLNLGMLGRKAGSELRVWMPPITTRLPVDIGSTMQEILES